MRYALISDIHGNLPALQAVINDAKNKGIDRYFFLGDYYLSVPYPNEVASVLRNFEHAFIISGNEEIHIDNLE